MKKIKMKKPTEDPAHFIVNDKNMTFISTTLQKLSKNSDEKSKDEHILTTDKIDCKTHKGIDIKKNTDSLTNDKILQLIDEELYGDNSSEFGQVELNRMLSDLNICRTIEDSFMTEIPVLFEDSAKTILKREKGEHLSFAEKQYIYNCNKVKGETLSDIWKRTGLSISTAKSIIKQFELSPDSKSIIKKIRCKKLIKSEMVRNLIRSYVNTQSICFTAAYIQLHLKTK